jgi:alkylhydroperoxidase family enzyme
MAEIPPSEPPPVCRPRTPQERQALWKAVQQIWRKRATDPQDVLARLREEWEREPPAVKRP